MEPAVGRVVERIQAEQNLRVRSFGSFAFGSFPLVRSERQIPNPSNVQNDSTPPNDSNVKNVSNVPNVLNENAPNDE
jgi:hypothetical protein